MATLLRVRTAIAGPQGGNMLNTLYFRAETADADAAVEAAGNFWYLLTARMATSYSVATEPDVAEINTDTGEATGSQVSSLTPVSTGKLAAEPLPFATQALIRWPTTYFRGGRRLQGRTFVPGITEMDSEGGVPSNALRAALAAAAEALHTDVDTRAVIYSYTWHAWATVLGGTAWSQFAVLRSRRD